MSPRLLQILTEQVCTQVVHKPHPDPDSTVRIQNPSKPNGYCLKYAVDSKIGIHACVFTSILCVILVILKVIATLLKNSTPSAELMEVRRLFLSDMIKLFSNSRENRR